MLSPKEPLMTLLYSDPVFLKHDTGKHPERAERLLQVTAHLKRVGLDVRCGQPSWEAISRERLARVHGLDYVDEVARFAEAGGGRIEADTVVSRDSFQIDLPCCRGRLRRRAEGDRGRRPSRCAWSVRRGITLCATRRWASACSTTSPWGPKRRLPNSSSIGCWSSIGTCITATARRTPSGTTGRSGSCRFTAGPFIPAPGGADETGTGRGLGTTRICRPSSARRGRITSTLYDRAASPAQPIKPELVIVSAGFDAHRDDPVGSLGLETEDFATHQALSWTVADAYAGGRWSACLEGATTRAYWPAASNCICERSWNMLESPLARCRRSQFRAAPPCSELEYSGPGRSNPVGPQRAKESP